jgi:3-methyladenine DNA glycosylase AlkD
MTQTNISQYRNEIIRNIREKLILSADAKTKESSPNFFKEPVKLYGVKVPVVNKISKEFYKQVKNFDKTVVWELCEELWKSGFMEESFIACHWSDYQHKQYTPDDFLIFEKWLKMYVDNWASCDTLCNHTIGTFVEMYPEFLEKLITWTQSENRWVRRGAAVTLIIPARHGKFLADVFKISDALLVDKDDLVQKGYGWMLKAASESHQKEVFDYVLKHKAIMPRTALRYAIEKMPVDLKKAAMQK